MLIGIINLQVETSEIIKKKRNLLLDLANLLFLLLDYVMYVDKKKL